MCSRTIPANKIEQLILNIIKLNIDLNNQNNVNANFKRIYYLAVQRKESPSAVAVDQTRAARARSAPPQRASDLHNRDWHGQILTTPTRPWPGSSVSNKV